MRMSQNGLHVLKQWEGEVKEEGLHVPYDDATGQPVTKGDNVEGYLTIGHGHLLDRSELNSEKVKIDHEFYEYWNGLTDTQAMLLFDNDLDWAEDTVNSAVRVPLTQNQFEALVSFTFNVGGTAFRSSTLLRKLNNREYNEVPTQMRRWTRSGGRVVQGLINRREKEIAHWNDNSSSNSDWRVKFFGG